jgi:hypothetical protein
VAAARVEVVATAAAARAVAAGTVRSASLPRCLA